MKKSAPALAPILLVISVLGSAAEGQVSPQGMSTIQGRLHQAKVLFDRLPEARPQALSAGAQNLIQLANMSEKQGLLAIARSQPAAQLPKAPSSFAASGGVVPVSDPSNDFAFSIKLGFSQSETSTAWCGSHVVVGFNDTGSGPESILFGPGGFSSSGVALSTDSGRDFTDLGFLNPGSNPANVLAGDPVVGCADARTFHYSQIFLTADSMGNPLAAVAVSTSSDGGATWADPVAAISKDGFTHVIDKPWMVVDPTNTSRVFVVYADFDFSVVCGPGGTRSAIELVVSTDGGITWGAPVVIDESCAFLSVPGLFDQGAQVAVGPGGEVYVAWEFYQADYFTREIRLRRSTDHGVTFAPLVKVADVVKVGDGFSLQGGFRTGLDLGAGLAVDRSGAFTKGTVYITWHDGRNLEVPDVAYGFYGYADVLVARSTDQGATWSVPVRVNTNSEPLPDGRGTDQYQPGIAVDNSGNVGICWYDRRLDPVNYQIDRYCGVSTDGGASFSNSRKSSPSWSPIHGTDNLLDPTYMGDYDGVTSDFTQHSPGFVGAFQMMNTRGGLQGNSIPVPNPDVFATSFR